MGRGSLRSPGEHARRLLLSKAAMFGAKICQGISGNERRATPRGPGLARPRAAPRASPWSLLPAVACGDTLRPTAAPPAALPWPSTVHARSWS
jgi:hypothetical protein